jgi:hypothetical protein
MPTALDQFKVYLVELQQLWIHENQLYSYFFNKTFLALRRLTMEQLHKIYGSRP